MILRIRTNISAIRLEVEGSLTVEELVTLILNKLEVTNSSTLTLSLDMNGNNVFSRNSLATVLSLGLRHGDEVHVLDRFEVVVIEKDYINDQHDLIKAGKKLKVIEAASTGNAEAIAVAAVLPLANEPSPSHEKGEANNDNTNTTQEVVHDDGGWSAALAALEGEEEDNHLRSPDAIQKMKLIDDSPSHFKAEPRGYQAPLLQAEDYRELEGMRAELLAAGLDRGEVAAIVEERANQILSDR